MIDSEIIDLGQVRRWFNKGDNFPTSKNNNAMLCLLKHQESNQTIVIGNLHPEHHPMKDHLKFAQHAFFLEKAAKYIRDNRGDKETLPFICGGDFNSLPISSVMNIYHDENFEELSA